jgi:molybdopterin molybdotransferase
VTVSPLEALEKIITNIKPLNTQIVPIENALGRVIAEDIYASFSLPKFHNSAMDGYAISSLDNSVVKVIDKIFAGDDNSTVLIDNTCIKIMTGAKIPQNTVAIVPQEDVQILENGDVVLPKNIRKMQHIRNIGEDISEGEQLISSGEEINFAKITILSSMGITHINVYKKPKVVVFASGDELKQHYEIARSYQIYNSNTPTLIARCLELGCDVEFSKTSSDDLESLKDLISSSLRADLIVTTGGVSVGEADFTKRAFSELGFETIFDGIVIKPGKPTVFGKIGNSYVLNLPGNPLATSLIFEMFGKIIIQKLRASNAIYHNYINAKLSSNLSNKAGRVTLVVGDFDGTSFIPSAKSSPGMVNVLHRCNSLIALGEEVSNLNVGDIVKVLPINWNFLSDKYKDFLTR